MRNLILVFVRIVAVAAAAAGVTAAQTVSELDRAMTDTLARWNVPGGALAVAWNGRLVYAKGYGLADVDAGEPVRPDSLFRIASVSKTFTAAGILKLVEEGKLDLDAKAFDILSDLRPPDGAAVDPRIRSITVRHLMQHTGGWDRDLSGDPLAPPYPQLAARALGVPEPAEPEIIIRYALGQPLDFDPGTRMAYSNLGYCILGRIIEKTSGMRYDAYIRSRILGPAGIYRMFPARVFPEDRAAGEVRYYSWPGEEILLPSAFPDRPGMVVPQYGAAYPETMDSEGGWAASAIDLVRFAVALDRPVMPLLRPETLQLMSRVPDAALIDASGVWYGMGWFTWNSGSGVDMSHSGGLPGTRSFLLKRANGVVWAILFNSGSLSSGDPFIGDAANRVDAAVRSVRTWPLEDQFPRYYPDAPRFAATGIQNLASYTAGPVSPGEVVIISGAGFEQAEEEIHVLFDGVPARTIPVGSNQIGAEITETLTGGTSSMQLERGGHYSEIVTVAAAAAAPGIYTANNTGRGQAAAVNQDGTDNAPDNPAPRGTLLVISVTGIRETEPCSILLGTTVIEGAALRRAAPGTVLAEFRIPGDAPAGPEVPVVISAAGNKSRTGVTVAIR